jgi:hypothetical protein
MFSNVKFIKRKSKRIMRKLIPLMDLNNIDVDIPEKYIKFISSYE